MTHIISKVSDLSECDKAHFDKDDEYSDRGTTDDSTDPMEDDQSERKRKKLMEAISSIGGQMRKTLNERSEASIQMSEFSTEGEGDKINLSDLIHTMEETTAVSNRTTKQLKDLTRLSTGRSLKLRILKP